MEIAKLQNLSAARYGWSNLEQVVHTAWCVCAARGMAPTLAAETQFTPVRVCFVEIARFSAGLNGRIRLLAISSSLNDFMTRTISGFLIGGAARIEVGTQRGRELGFRSKLCIHER
jgi:hypothetical protein